MNEYIVFGIFGIIVLILILYIYIKDNEVQKKLFLFEKVIEDLNKKLHDLNKKIDLKNEHETEKRLKIYLDNIMDENLDKISQYIMSKNNEQYKELQKLRQEIYEKIEEIDEKIKEFVLLPGDYKSNDKKIIELYKKGLSVSEIARNLRVGIGEVELVLKIEGIR